MSFAYTIKQQDGGKNSVSFSIIRMFSCSLEQKISHSYTVDKQIGQSLLINAQTIA